MWSGWAGSAKATAAVDKEGRSAFEAALTESELTVILNAPGNPKGSAPAQENLEALDLQLVE